MRKRITMKKYRDITWNGSDRDLSIKLGICENAVWSWLKAHPGKTQEDYIDYILDKRIVKTYRDITWNGSDRDLSIKLGRVENVVCTWLKAHPGKTQEDYIDMILDNKGTVKTYRGITWNGSDRDLSIKLGRGESAFRNWLNNNFGKTQEDYIDFVTNSKKRRRMPLNMNHNYRGITWNGSDRDLSVKLGKSHASCSEWLKHNSSKTQEEYIDLCLGELTYEEYKIEMGIV